MRRLPVGYDPVTVKLNSRVSLAGLPGAIIFDAEHEIAAVPKFAWYGSGVLLQKPLLQIAAVHRHVELREATTSGEAP